MARKRRINTGLCPRGPRYGGTVLPVCLLLLAGCHLTPAGDDSLDLGPFYREEVYPDEATAWTGVVVPFFSVAEREEAKHVALRPLFDYLEFDGGARGRWEALFPIFRYRWNAWEKNFHAAPFFFHRRRKIGTPLEEVDWTFIPFLWGGSSKNGEEDYFALFPLFGSIHSFLSYERFRFFLFPLYSDATKRQYGERKHSTNILWPILGWSHGGGEDSFRLLPFYGYTDLHDPIHDRDVYKRSYYLWPFFHLYENQLDTDDPTSGWMLWPLYGQEISERSRQYQAIWPLFGYSEFDANPKNPLDTDRWLLDLFAGLVKVQRGGRKTETGDWADEQRFRILPFYHFYHSAQITSEGWLWPLIWDRQERLTESTKDSFYVVPFYYQTDKRYHQTGERESFTKLWPLFHHESLRDGSSDFGLLSLYFMRTTLKDEEGTFLSMLEGVDRHYGFLWTLYRERHTQEGGHHRELFLKLYDQYWDSERESISIPLLFHYDWSRPRETSRHSFLFGLVQVHDRRGEGSLQLFYLPPFIYWGEAR
ncbi:MAG: hypothetical protein RL885_10525 [Planctomycetota bacterium]